MPKYFISALGLATRLSNFNGVVHASNGVYSKKV